MKSYLVINNGHGYKKYVSSPLALASLRCHGCEKLFTLNEWSELPPVGKPVHKTVLGLRHVWTVSKECPCGHSIAVDVVEVTETVNMDFLHC